MHNLYLLHTTNEGKNLAVKLICFFFCPFWAFVISLRDAASRSSYVIYALFGLVFAWHLNPTGVDRYDDLEGIMLRFINSSFTFQDIKKQIIGFFTFSEESPKEIYENVLIWFTKLFSNNPHLFFFFAAIPFLIVYLKSLRQITSDKRFNSSIIALIVLVLFVLPRDLITLQNPRFATGTWIAIYATIKLWKDDRIQWRYLFLICLTPCFHSGFWFYVIVTLIGIYAYHFTRLSYILLFISIPVSYYSYELLTGNLSILPLPPFISNWVQRGLSEDKYNVYIANAGASGFYWVSNIFTVISKTTYLIIPIYLWKQRKSFISNRSIYKLFSFYLYLYATVNFIQSVPILGTRFYWLVRILSIYLWFKIVYPKKNYVLYLILLGCSWEIFRRYFYTGALYTSVPKNIFYSPLPILISDFWGATGINPL